ncbi:MAG: TonB-dependent receptor plug domain-containing protein, partial [Bacteroidota bacterium]
MRVSVALALLLLASGARGQAADSVQTGDLGAEVVVTASRLLDAARQTGRHVTVLTAADLQASPGRSLGEVLRTAAGLDVTPRGASGTQADFSIRGSTFNGVLMLVDGARFNDSMTGHFLSDFPVPLAEIARVEILRGPA